MSKTDIVGLWDSDVIVCKKQIVEAVKAVKEGATLCYPYDRRFIFLDIEQSKKAREDMVLFFNNLKKRKTNYLSGRTLVGGVFIVNKQRYLQLGGDNENFYGWGFEDAERYKRLEILQEPIKRISGDLFHLYHPRGLNSTYGNDERSRNNIKEFIKVCRMNTDALRKYTINL